MAWIQINKSYLKKLMISSSFYCTSCRIVDKLIKGEMEMLVLSRKQHQSLVIGDNVKITVLELKGNQVRLGFDAPDSIVVHREEIHKKIS